MTMLEGSVSVHRWEISGTGEIDHDVLRHGLGTDKHQGIVLAFIHAKAAQELKPNGLSDELPTYSGSVHQPEPLNEQGT
jgi:hypothetical protein